MKDILFSKCNLLDTTTGKILPEHHVLVEGSHIKEVSDRPLKAGQATIFDLAGRTLMPGLCDAHVHVTAVEADFAKIGRLSPAYITARAAQILKGMLSRGFTTVRDAGGADWGLAQAVQEGLLPGPRILYCGHALSQTGGHGDTRARGDDQYPQRFLNVGTLGRICDGITGVRRAAREEIRKGAHQLKIMASGGVASPNDPIGYTQFSLGEMRAIVEEAEAAETYVMAHAYTSRAVKRALTAGVRSIEHGNLIDRETLDLLVEKHAFFVPTLVTYGMLVREGLESGFPPEQLVKVNGLYEQALAVLEAAQQKGAQIAFGTDLIGGMHRHQSLEFGLRREVQKPVDIIQSATTRCAQLFNLTGQIGVIAPGAYADLLVIDGNPLEDWGLLQDPESHISIIMKEGKFFKKRLP
ncbi:MAG: amidohydrolase family protein [Deltaproteobacteria bacterium]|nr:MAG: amidohydrolase family protein [Deltaproteobacteria bacterium]